MIPENVSEKIRISMTVDRALNRSSVRLPSYATSDPIVRTAPPCLHRLNKSRGEKVLIPHMTDYFTILVQITRKTPISDCCVIVRRLIFSPTDSPCQLTPYILKSGLHNYAHPSKSSIWCFKMKNHDVPVVLR